jgi:hypothetical protein
VSSKYKRQELTLASLSADSSWFGLQNLRDSLAREFPDLFGGLKDGGISVKTFPSTSNLGADAVKF